jgi:hypothetical protein
MFNNPNVFKGELLDDCVFEEAGEFKFLLKGYSATKQCFAVGDTMVGTPYVYGTGGKITSSSAEFKEMWYDYEAYNLERNSIYGDRIFTGFYIGSKNSKGEIEENCPNIRKMQEEQGLDDSQILGCEDVQAARDRIMSRRAELIKARNKEAYYEYFLDNPLNQRESFLNFSGNDFNPEAIAEQREYVSINEGLYKEYLLDWVTDHEGKFVLPHRVTAVPFDLTNPLHQIREDEVVLIRYMPDSRFKNLDIVGIDSYDQDKAATSKSLGAIVVLRRKGHQHKDRFGNPCGHKRIPICLYRKRPKTKNIFYDIGMKVAVFYDTVYNTLIEAGKPGIIYEFEKAGLEKFLAVRPQSFESIYSEQSHKYGVLLTNVNGRGSKPQMISLLQTYVNEELDECVFEHIIEGFAEYDIQQKDSDWDEIDALGVALMRDIDMKAQPKPKEVKEDNSRFALPEYGEFGNGTIIKSTEYNNNLDEGSRRIHDPFTEMIKSGYFDNEE